MPASDTEGYLFEGKYGTGARQLTYDPRDWSALLHPGIAQGVHAGVPDTIPDLSLGKTGGVYDQDGEGACVAYSEAGLVSLDLALAGQPWIWMDAENLYRRNGGTGQNGVDTRGTLEDIRANGINRREGGGTVKIDSYLFVPKTPGLFKDTIMAALAIGKPCVVATLLPQNFGWDSSGPPNPNAYHQVIISGGDPTWAYILNSWSERWGRSGRGRLLWSHLDPTRWDVYSYLVNPLGTLPTPLPPPPPPPPPPVIVKRYVVTAKATGQGMDTLGAGTSLTGSGGGFSGNLEVTNVAVYEDNTPPPPPDQMAVTGYSANPVKPGTAFTILGRKFLGGNLFVTWQGQSLAVTTRTDTSLLVAAPVSEGTAPVVVRVEGSEAQGPPLTVSAGGNGGGGGDLVIEASAAVRGRSRWLQVGVRDGSGWVAATVTPTAAGIGLGSKLTTPSGDSYVAALWIISAIAPGTPIVISVNASGRQATRTLTVPGDEMDQDAKATLAA